VVKRDDEHAREQSVADGGEESGADQSGEVSGH
jgi:hypothetical protein